MVGSYGSKGARLRARHRAVRALRGWLDQRGWVEVQTPLIAGGTCPDVALESFVVQGGRAGWLVTSTEYQIKRLMCEPDLDRVYTLQANFRPGDIGDRHNPEFTMLEWARRGAAMEEVEQEAEGMIREAWRAVCGGPSRRERRMDVRWGGQAIRLDGRWGRWTIRDLLSDLCGVEIGSFGEEEIREGARRLARLGRGGEVGADGLPVFCRDLQDLLSWMIAEGEAHIADTGRPVWLVDWPAVMTPSAARKPGQPDTAIRSELFIAGLEIADGFPFLTDAGAQARLFEEEVARRAALGLPEVAPDQRFLDALRRGLPPGAGMALGVDRLCMILTGAERISEVMAFGWEER